jgi:hypothetical protein
MGIDIKRNYDSYSPLLMKTYKFQTGIYLFSHMIHHHVDFHNHSLMALQQNEEVQVTMQTTYSGTPLYERLRLEDRILQEGAWKLCTLLKVSFHPSNMTVSGTPLKLMGAPIALFFSDSRFN